MAFYNNAGAATVQNAFWGAIFVLKTIILPRQARDKHREN
jgi:hypothetical protein